MLHSYINAGIVVITGSCSGETGTCRIYRKYQQMLQGCCNVYCCICGVCCSA